MLSGWVNEQIKRRGPVLQWRDLSYGLGQKNAAAGCRVGRDSFTCCKWERAWQRRGSPGELISPYTHIFSTHARPCLVFKRQFF